jgi:hypothetical protein
VQNWNESLQDTKVPSKNVAFERDGAVRVVESNDDLFDNGNVIYDGRPNSNALSQFNERLSGPNLKWLLDTEKCPPSIRANLLNDLVIVRDSMDWLIRTRTKSPESDTIIRACLSQQYTPFDNYDLVQAMDAALKSDGLDQVAQVFRPEVGDQMRAFLMFPNGPVGQSPSGGSIHTTVYFSDNEIGGGKVRITGGVWDGGCTNSIIAGYGSASEFSFIHRWHQTPEHLRVTVNEAIASAMKLSEQAAIKFLETQAVELQPTSLAKIVDEWGDKYGLSISTRENWLDLAGIKRPTQFNVISAATETARDLSSSDEREQTERMAGDLVYAELDVHRLQDYGENRPGITFAR